MQDSDGVAQVNEPEHLHREVFDDEQLHVHRHRDEVQVRGWQSRTGGHRAHLAIALHVRRRERDARCFKLDRLDDRAGRRRVRLLAEDDAGIGRHHRGQAGMGNLDH
jgi:hypothetical protein